MALGRIICAITHRAFGPLGALVAIGLAIFTALVVLDLPFDESGDAVEGIAILLILAMGVGHWMLTGRMPDVDD
jgi:hypothetical protein